MKDVCMWQIDSPGSSLRSQHCVFARSSSPRGWRPSAASSSPTCPSVLRRWTHPARAPLSDEGQFIILIRRGPLHSWDTPSFSIYTRTTMNTCTLLLYHSMKPLQQPDTEHFNHSWNILSCQKNVTNTHHLHFHQPVQISGQPLGLGSSDCNPRPALRGRLSSADK